MKLIDSKLARVLDDLSEYSFEVRYYPGKDNIFADTWSRCHRSEDQDEEPADPCALPGGLTIMKLVPGGADSLFISLRAVLEDVQVQGTVQNHKVLRETLMDTLIEDRKMYGVEKKQKSFKYFRALRMTGREPVPEVLLVASDMFEVKIWLHHGTCCSVVYLGHKVGKKENLKSVHIQVLGGTHFNPLRNDGTFNSNNRNIMVDELPSQEELQQEEEEVEDSENELSEEPGNNLVHYGTDEGLDINLMMRERCHISRLSCNHVLGGVAWQEVCIGVVRKCAFLDTGAVISLIQEGVVQDLENFGYIRRKWSINLTLNGVTTGIVECNMAVEIEISTLYRRVVLPLAVVQNGYIPACMLLGMNLSL